MAAQLIFSPCTRTDLQQLDCWGWLCTPSLNTRTKKYATLTTVTDCYRIIYTPAYQLLYGLMQNISSCFVPTYSNIAPPLLPPVRALEQRGMTELQRRPCLSSRGDRLAFHRDRRQTRHRLVWGLHYLFPRRGEGDDTGR